MVCPVNIFYTIYEYMMYFMESKKFRQCYVWLCYENPLQKYVPCPKSGYASVFAYPYPIFVFAPE